MKFDTFNFLISLFEIIASPEYSTSDKFKRLDIVRNKKVSKNINKGWSRRQVSETPTLLAVGVMENKNFSGSQFIYKL